MKVSGFQKVILVLRFAMVSVIDSFRAVLGSFILRHTRQQTLKVVHGWAIKVLQIAKINFKVFDPYNFQFKPDRSYIIISNHASHFDIPIIYNTFPQESIGMIAKKELFKIPVFGWGMRMAGCISIDRENKRQALRDLEQAKKSMLDGLRLWVAPEGTRSRTGELRVFKKGGFKIARDTQAIVVPVTIVGSHRVLPAKTFDFSVGEDVAVYIGKPIDANDYNGDLQKLMSDTREEIASHLDDLE